MHEGKGLSSLSGETKMDIQDTVTDLTTTKKLGGKDVTIIPRVGVGILSGDDSSSDNETPIQRTHVVPPKKNRLKEPNNNFIHSKNSTVRSPMIICNGNNDTKDIMNNDDPNQDDEESSGPSTKEGGISTSFTSGENSDADGDESMGVSLKHEDSRKIFECDVCNMKFSNGANMRRHRMRHTGVKPYECRVCQKRFFRKDHLAEHMATHSKLLPFRCPICNKGFQRQIAMRAHFQNEHVGGSHDMVKACPLCTYKAGSMKSLRVHFYSRHGIDLDNPMPHSPSLQTSSNGGGGSGGSPGPCGSGNGEYSELAHALGFENSEKSNDSIIPSHFLVPQIEISNSPYPPHFPFTADSSYNFAQDERHSNGNHRSSSPSNVSPQSDSSSNLPSSSDLVSVVVKKEIMDEQNSSPEQSSSSAGETKSKSSDIIEDIQDVPEDLSSSSSASIKLFSPKCSSSSIVKVSPLKSLLREDWRKDNSQNGGSNNSSAGTSASSGRLGTSTHSAHNNNSIFHQQGYEGEGITSSNGSENGIASHSMFSRRGVPFPAPLHQCVYCGIIFPDKTLYFLHKGCHSDSNPWRCNICGELCCNVYDFNSHLLSKSHQ